MNNETQKIWYFEDDYLCTHEGDRLTEGNVCASQIVRQMDKYRELGEFIYYGYRRETAIITFTNYLYKLSLNPL